MSKVISGFKCRHTRKIYHVGDTYDGDYAEEMLKKGYIDQSSTGENVLVWPRHTGGGNYELSNGEKVKGKKEAFTAQAELDAAAEGSEDKKE